MQKVSVNENVARFIEKCKTHGLKVTPQRIAIYKEIYGSKDHPSAEIVYRIVREIFPNISFDTVNRTLLTFSKIGIVEVVEGYGSPRRFDPNLENHHHLLCVNCGQVLDFFDDKWDNIQIPNSLKSKFTVLGKRVVFKGFCERCKNIC